jgi:glycine oxidase
MAFDVIVAGAGMIGSSIAWRLAQRGLRVALLDAARVGAEASSAGAGMLAPGGEIEGHSPWNEFALESLRLYADFVSELESETGHPIDYRRSGAVEIALTEEEWSALGARAQVQAGLGIPSCPCSPNDIPLLRAEIAGGLFYPEDALVDPRDVMSALRAACERSGVAIREELRVTEIRPKADSVEVVSSEEALEAGAAVVAAGAWTSLIAIEGVRLPRAFPVRGHLMGFHLDPGSLGPILRRGHTYLLQRASGFTVAGTSSEDAGFERRLNPEILTDIHQRAAELIPALASRTADERWVGFRPAIESDGPAIGRVADTALWTAYGHYRNGILMAPATAARVAAEITSSWGMGSSAPRGSR